jgi:hypothetical protein
VDAHRRNAWIRLTLLFGTIPIAFAVGWIAHSENAFVGVMAIGLLVGAVLRFTVLR